MKNKDILAGKEEIYDFRYLQITVLSTQNIQNNPHVFRIKGDFSKATEYEIKDKRQWHFYIQAIKLENVILRRSSL